MQVGSPQLPSFCHMHQHSHFLWVPLRKGIHRRWHTTLQPNVRMSIWTCVTLVLVWSYAVPFPFDRKTCCYNYEKCDILNCCFHPSHRCYNECREGQCSGSPRFECECSLGWTSDPATLVLSGVECDVDCGCNFHSTCITAPGICDECQGKAIISYNKNTFVIMVKNASFGTNAFSSRLDYWASLWAMSPWELWFSPGWG